MNNSKRLVGSTLFVGSAVLADGVFSPRDATADSKKSWTPNRVLRNDIDRLRLGTVDRDGKFSTHGSPFSFSDNRGEWWRTSNRNITARSVGLDFDPR